MKNVTFKVTEFDVNRIKRDMFETKKAHEYFLMGFYAALELQKLKDLGHVILDGDEPFDRRYNFHISFYEEEGQLSMPRLGPYRNGGMTMWLGSTMGNIPNTIFVYKSELNEAFGKITHFKPAEVTKFKVKSIDEYTGL